MHPRSVQINPIALAVLKRHTIKLAWLAMTVLSLIFFMATQQSQAADNPFAKIIKSKIPINSDR